MKAPKPIKRSKELVPLSKDHHEGLLAAWKIKQGLRNGTNPKVIADFIQWFWKTDLQEHFRKEEEVLAPHLPRYNELVAQMKEEHEELTKLVRLCEEVWDDNSFLRLADSLNSHIRFEERELFPFAEKVIPSEKMEAIYQELVQEKPHSRWENEFWVSKK
jgi:hemerythrin-like domain-containing protein